MNINTYLAYRKAREQTPFIIENGKGYYLVKGERVCREEMEKTYPLPPYVTSINLNAKKVNPDSLHNYLSD